MRPLRVVAGALTVVIVPEFEGGVTDADGETVRDGNANADESDDDVADGASE
jgi:hypothetical protein